MLGCLWSSRAFRAAGASQRDEKSAAAVMQERRPEFSGNVPLLFLSFTLFSRETIITPNSRTLCTKHRDEAVRETV